MLSQNPSPSLSHLSAMLPASQAVLIQPEPPKHTNPIAGAKENQQEASLQSASFQPLVNVSSMNPGAHALQAQLQTLSAHKATIQCIDNTTQTEPELGFELKESIFLKPYTTEVQNRRYIGFSFVFGDNDDFLLRTNSSEALNISVLKNDSAYRAALQQARSDKDTQERLALATRIGELLWPEYENGRTGKLGSIAALFTPAPMFTATTRFKAALLLHEARSKGIISLKLHNRAEARLSATIPAQDVDQLLDLGMLAVVTYRSLALQDGKPVIKRHIEVHPAEGYERNAWQRQVYEYECADAAKDAGFLSALDAHIRQQGWLSDTSLLPEAPEHQQLINDPQAALESLTVCRYRHPTLGPVLNHVRNLALTIRTARHIQRNPACSPERHDAMRRNVFRLEGMLTRFLMAHLKDTTPSELKLGLRGLCKEVTAQTYPHVLAALNRVIASLPENERRHHATLLHDCVEPARVHHAQLLVKGATSPFMKVMDDIAGTVATVMH